MNPLRPIILAAAGSDRMKRAITRTPVTAGVVRRFVAGETRAALLPVVRELLASGRTVSVDFLGEYTTERAMADAAVTEYLALIGELAALDRAVPESPGAAAKVSGDPGTAAAPKLGRGLDTAVPRVEVSLKLSALGQSLGADGPAIAAENLHKLCAKAAESRVWVTVDAEDHTTTEETVAAVRQARTEFPWLGLAVQTYLRDAEGRCRDLAADGTRIRLCKGAYQEPETVAYQKRAEVDGSYLECLDVLMRGNGYPMVASHDPAMIDAVFREAAENGRGAGDFEFQMLYGIRDAEQRRLVGEGHALRVYVPYGGQWYGYLMRRLAERPANVGFFLRALTERG
ncbi:proline dehydrogenase family protein [Nocardia sp. 2]|uniref:proline dehydrogenase n=1 Tax=Nocardia acididurans TaxID=2802282 RepID=A0ABS1M625_9NOCA|nr:proline dehydrogenase family protein [Nocardia acididurans]MBL1076092.1 proline dehydrogenase family protein [Nocardia acididurans]